MELKPRLIQAALVAVSSLGVAACGCGNEGPKRHNPSSRGKSSAVDRHVPAGRSIWTRPVSDRALDPRSDRLVASLGATVDRGYATHRPAWIAIDRCSSRIYTVPRDQPALPVTLTDATVPYKRTLQAAFRKVPLPSDAQPSNCSDRTIVVAQPSRDSVWELWHARRDASGWHADWGGATRHASKNPGSFRPADWPGAQYNWGASATSMTMLGGVIRLAEVRRGAINHALALSLPDAAAGVWSWPAQRSDGDEVGPDAIPYGAQFRLDPRLDIDSLDAPAATKIIATAAQRYGLVVRERTHYGVSLSAEAPPPGGSNPWPQLLGATPGQVMQAFPWRRLQLLKMDLRSRAGGPSR